jgi:uncharacterized protein YjiS (DUF1127 family)
MTELISSLPRSLGLIALWKNITTRYIRHRDYVITVRDLERLSDRELNDIGIHRSMIRSIAMEAYYDNQTR